VYFESGCVEAEACVVRAWALAEAERGVVPGSRHALVLDRSVFHPQGGGQPSDGGVVVAASGARFVVAGARKGPRGGDLERAIVLYGAWAVEGGKGESEG